MRFWRELWHPEQKCERLGHKLTTVTKRIRRESFKGREVVADYDAEFEVCSRCSYRSEPRNEEKVDWYGGCSLPTSMWDEMKTKGYIEI